MTTIKICHGHACTKNLASYTFDRAKSDLDITDAEGGQNPKKKVKLEKCACQGRCKKGPIVVVERNGRPSHHEYTNPIEMGKIIKQIKK